MIVYDLKCRNGHTFEGWFKDFKAFTKQQKSGLITCPVCDDTGVDRIPSTFAIKGAPAQQGCEGPQPDPQLLAHAVAKYVQDNFDNVGSDVAKEALKIHYGVNQPRNIRGSSTAKEEEILRQEGVTFFKFPLPAPDPSSSESESES